MVTAAALGLNTGLQIRLRSGARNVGKVVEELSGRVGATAENILAKPQNYSRLRLSSASGFAGREAWQRRPATAITDLRRTVRRLESFLFSTHSCPARIVRAPTYPNTIPDFAQEKIYGYMHHNATLRRVIDAFPRAAFIVHATTNRTATRNRDTYAASQRIHHAACFRRRCHCARHDTTLTARRHRPAEPAA